jgi:hypothetical protein
VTTPLADIRTYKYVISVNADDLKAIRDRVSILENRENNTDNSGLEMTASEISRVGEVITPVYVAENQINMLLTEIRNITSSVQGSVVTQPGNQEQQIAVPSVNLDDIKDIKQELAWLTQNVKSAVDDTYRSGLNVAKNMIMKEIGDVKFPDISTITSVIENSVKMSVMNNPLQQTSTQSVPTTQSMGFNMSRAEIAQSALMRDVYGSLQKSINELDFGTLTMNKKSSELLRDRIQSLARLDPSKITTQPLTESQNPEASIPQTNDQITNETGINDENVNVDQLRSQIRKSLSHVFRRGENTIQSLFKKTDLPTSIQDVISGYYRQYVDIVREDPRILSGSNDPSKNFIMSFLDMIRNRKNDQTSPFMEMTHEMKQNITNVIDDMLQGLETSMSQSNLENALNMIATIRLPSVVSSIKRSNIPTTKINPIDPQVNLPDVVNDRVQNEYMSSSIDEMNKSIPEIETFIKHTDEMLIMIKQDTRLILEKIMGITNSPNTRLGDN